MLNRSNKQTTKTIFNIVNRIIKLCQIRAKKSCKQDHKKRCRQNYKIFTHSWTHTANECMYVCMCKIKESRYAFCNQHKHMPNYFCLYEFLIEFYNERSTIKQKKRAFASVGMLVFVGERLHGKITKNRTNDACSEVFSFVNFSNIAIARERL